MNTSTASKPNAESLYTQLFNKLKQAYPKPSLSSLGIAGIVSGGAWLAQRLAKDLGITDVGNINVAFHRDDYASKGLKGNTQSTSLPFDINAREILLVDDVLYTGRTVRAAINELFDFGRPSRIVLAVLVNRIEASARQLPYAANFSGADLVLPTEHMLVLEQDQNGHFDFVLEPQ